MTKRSVHLQVKNKIVASQRSNAEFVSASVHDWLVSAFTRGVHPLHKGQYAKRLLESSWVHNYSSRYMESGPFHKGHYMQCFICKCLYVGPLAKQFMRDLHLGRSIKNALISIDDWDHDQVYC